MVDRGRERGRVGGGEIKKGRRGLWSLFPCLSEFVYVYLHRATTRTYSQSH